MRLLAVCLGVTFLLTVFTVVTVVRTVRESDADSIDKFEVHAPDSDEERAAAKIAEQFSAAVTRKDAAAACRLAVDPVAREMRCASRPRFVPCRGDRAYHAREEGDIVDVYLDECHLHVAERPEGWRVSESIPPIGLL